MPFWKNYMYQRERWYHQRDNNRLVRPFDWGLSYIVDHVNGDDPRALFRQYTERVMMASDDFYALPEINDYRLDGDQLTWTSAIETPSVENNTAHGRFFPAKPKNGKRPRNAVVVLPQWNAQPVAGVRPDFRRPRREGRIVPDLGGADFGRRQMVDREVTLIAIAHGIHDFEAPRHQAARHP